jgi:2-C-methyl-D-erythritol 4-phosphate cytidylyltransferase
MKKYAVIVAGGSGTRMGTATPKQFLLLNNKPVLFYTLKTFFEALPDVTVILVLPEQYLTNGKEIIDAYFKKAKVHFAIGGKTRFDSVKNGLRLVTEESVVIVHDAVRCLLSKQLIQNSCKAALEFGAVVPVVSSKDSLRFVGVDSNKIIDRNNIKLVQTPQTFLSTILLPAFEIDYKEKFTDEASVVESFGIRIHLIEGEKQNIKITHPFDLEIAKYYLKQTN